MFIAQHIFAPALLAVAVSVALLVRHRSRIHRQRFAAHQPTSYPGAARAANRPRGYPTGLSRRHVIGGTAPRRTAQPALSRRRSPPWLKT